MSGSIPASRGSVQVALDAAISAERAAESANRGFWVSASLPPAPANEVYCETHSTPPTKNVSPSPALIAWKAIRIVWVELAQKRLIVAAGRWSMPASTAMTRAMFDPCRPRGSAQPQ
jgi:hypothetical protein